MVIWDKSVGDESVDRRTVPIAVSGNDIVDSQLLTDFFDAKMQGVSFKLFRGHVCLDHGRKAHETSGLVVGGIAPSVTLPTSLHAVGSRFS